MLPGKMKVSPSKMVKEAMKRAKTTGTTNAVGSYTATIYSKPTTTKDDKPNLITDLSYRAEVLLRAAVATTNQNDKYLLSGWAAFLLGLEKEGKVIVQYLRYRHEVRDLINEAMGTDSNLALAALTDKWEKVKDTPKTRTWTWKSKDGGVAGMTIKETHRKNKKTGVTTITRKRVKR